MVITCEKIKPSRLSVGLPNADAFRKIRSFLKNADAFA